MHPSEVHWHSDSACKKGWEKRLDRNKIVGQMVYVSEGIIANTFNAHDEDSSESDGSSSSQAMEVDSLGRRNHDDSMYSSSENSVRARKKEAAGDVSMQGKEQNEQTETVILSKEAGDTSMHDKKQTTDQVREGTEEPRPPPSGQQSSQNSKEAHPSRCWNSPPLNEIPRRRYQRRGLACK